MEASELVAVFDRCFANDGSGEPVDRARMVRGGDEPLFLPAGPGRPLAEVVYARGFAASCLHEAAHWLVAGPSRRLLVDYGYWYLPDGRDASAQRRFEQHETPVQAMEWILCQAAGRPFVISCDNLDDPTPTPAFATSIGGEAERLLQAGLSERAGRLCQALCWASGASLPLPESALPALLACAPGAMTVRA